MYRTILMGLTIGIHIAAHSLRSLVDRWESHVRRTAWMCKPVEEKRVWSPREKSILSVYLKFFRSVARGGHHAHCYYFLLLLGFVFLSVGDRSWGVIPPTLSFGCALSISVLSTVCFCISANGEPVSRDPHYSSLMKGKAATITKTRIIIIAVASPQHEIWGDRRNFVEERFKCFELEGQKAL